MYLCINPSEFVQIKHSQWSRLLCSSDLISSELHLPSWWKISRRLSTGLTLPWFRRRHLPCHCLAACLALPTPSLLLLAQREKKMVACGWRRGSHVTARLLLQMIQRFPPGKRKKNHPEQLWRATYFWFFLHFVQCASCMPLHGYLWSFSPSAYLLLLLLSDLLIASDDCVSQVSKELLNHSRALATDATATAQINRLVTGRGSSTHVQQGDSHLYEWKNDR